MASAPASRYLSLFFKNSNQYKLHISLFPFRQVDHIDQLLNRSCESCAFNSRALFWEVGQMSEFNKKVPC